MRRRRTAPVGPTPPEALLRFRLEDWHDPVEDDDPRTGPTYATGCRFADAEERWVHHTARAAKRWSAARSAWAEANCTTLPERNAALYGPGFDAGRPDPRLVTR